MTKSWGRLSAFLGPRILSMMALALGAGIALFAAELAFAYALQAFLFKMGLIAAGTPALPAWAPQSALAATLALFFFGSARGALNGAQIYMQGAVQEELRLEQRSRLLRWAFASDAVSSAEVTTLLNARIEAMGMAIGGAQALAVHLTSGILLGGTLAFMAPRLTLAVAALVCTVIPALRSADRKIRAAGAEIAAEWERINARILMSIKNLLLLQIHATLRQEEAAAEKSFLNFKKHTLSYFSLSGLKYAIPQVLGVLLVALIGLAGMQGRGLAASVAISYLYLLLRFLQIFATANQDLSGIMMNWPQARQLWDWWEEKAAPALAARAAESARADAGRSGARFDRPIGWRLTDVDFAHPGSAPLFSRFNLVIEPGRLLVVTGASGAGKSTLISLLLGAARPKRGQVELVVDGRTWPLGERRGELLQSVGYVGPESFLIEGTIRDNLAYGLGRAPEQEEISAALAEAECGFVAALPRGLDHRLSEQGHGLSAGQKQRLGLARAFLRRPAVLILDEATSNLDAETEARVVETLRRKKGTLTIVAVTHRAALLHIADARLALDVAAARAPGAPINL